MVAGWPYNMNANQPHLPQGQPRNGSPPRVQREISALTPHTTRKIVAAKQEHQDLASSREALRWDTHEADVIPIEELLNSICGKVEDLARIRANLVAGGFLSDEGWKAFYNAKKNSFLPVDSGQKEDATFQALATIFDQCLRAAGIPAIPASNSRVELKVHGDKHMATSFPNGTRPDATIHLTQTSLPWPRTDKIDHADVYVYIEVKKAKTGEHFEDDVNKLLWNVHHRFRSDPRCRFVCGLTIENTTSRFWHFSRAAVMVSEPFDMIRNADHFIRIFVSSARAPTASHLGFDPTIKCIRQDADEKAVRHYEIQVHDNKDKSQRIPGKPGHVHTFTTTRCLSNYRAVGIRSRGTWVFEGLDSNDSSVVIKDVWIDQDREVEGSILENVRDSLAKESPGDLKLFLDPLCHGTVLIDESEDVTQPLLRPTGKISLRYTGHSSLTPLTSAPTTSLKRKHGTGESSAGSIPKLPTADQVVIGRRGDRRKHYRIVFKGKAGRALYNLDNYHDVLTGLLGGVKALHALYKAGYIHRDLSSGNVLLVEGADKASSGVLIDLEYAKRFPDLSKRGHDVRTGTMEFMAVEVDSHEFLFEPRKSVPLAGLPGLSESPDATTSSELPPWFHNPIHDLESAWWIAVWSYYRLDSGMDKASLFNGDRHRSNVLTAEGFFRRLCREIPPHILNKLDGWLTFIRWQYMALEEGLSKDPNFTFDYNPVFDAVLLYIEATAKVLVPEPDPPVDTEASLIASSPSPNKRRKLGPIDDPV